jgi:hypothetical protein
VIHSECLVSPAHPSTFGRLVHAILGVALAAVIFAVLADPTPNFLGVRGESDADEVLPAGSAKGDDFSPPLVGKPTEKAATGAGPIGLPSSCGMLEMLEASWVAHVSLEPVPPSPIDHTRRSPLRC